MATCPRCNGVGERDSDFGPSWGTIPCGYCQGTGKGKRYNCDGDEVEDDGSLVEQKESE